MKYLTKERLWELLNYDPDTGIFTRRVARGSYKAGEVAGRVATNGYIDISVDGRRYGGHRLAWLYMTGRWPANDCEHKDRVRSNNAWSNLREATRSQNLGNVLAKGIQKNGKGWQATIMIRGKRMMLGTYNTSEEARDVYRHAALTMRGDFAPAEYRK